jgi:prepilin-type N-terminal cleavage/methylation domain-containing protein
MKRTQGFTLVEIAIVLVIIGLLLGGILKGQEMITQAKIKNLIADFSGVSAAYHGYQDRYRAIPGDDPGAAARWAVAPVAVNGSGNGVVAGAYNVTPCVLATESCSFWDHLRRAGFVAGTGPLQPFNAVTGFIGVQSGNAAGAAALGGFVSLLLCSANMPDKMAIAVDTQMDDADARTGTVRGQLHVGGPNPAINNAADAANYAETGTNVYTLCRTL